MSEPVKCFFLEPTNLVRRFLRRYHSSDETQKCPASYGYHNAHVLIDEIEDTPEGSSGDLWPHDDPRWPGRCPCGYQFLDSDQWQLFRSPLWRRADSGQLVTLEEAPAGAIWDATWMPDKHQDGRYLICKLPNGHHWSIDSVCSNCTRPTEKHECWVRHGEPPNLTVDKNGDTCAAGAGSIWSRQGKPDDWHGFLRNGYLVKC